MKYQSGVDKTACGLLGENNGLKESFYPTNRRLFHSYYLFLVDLLGQTKVSKILNILVIHYILFS